MGEKTIVDVSKFLENGEQMLTDWADKATKPRLCTGKPVKVK